MQLVYDEVADGNLREGLFGTTRWTKWAQSVSNQTLNAPHCRCSSIQVLHIPDGGRYSTPDTPTPAIVAGEVRARAVHAPDGTQAIS